MEDKKFKVESFMKISELVKFMNTKRLTKEDIVSTFLKDDFFYLIYID